MMPAIESTNGVLKFNNYKSTKSVNKIKSPSWLICMLKVIAEGRGKATKQQNGGQSQSCFLMPQCVLCVRAIINSILYKQSHVSSMNDHFKKRVFISIVLLFYYNSFPAMYIH